MSKFKVGDLVVRGNSQRANNYEEYIYTNKNAGKMLIVPDTMSRKSIKVKILSHTKHKIQVGEEYYVNEKDFDLYVPIKLTENSTELERWLYLLNT